jgi:hypothetical protein
MKLILIKDNRTDVIYFEVIGRTRRKTRWPKVKELNLYEPYTKKYRKQKVIISLAHQDKKYCYVEVLKMKNKDDK